MSTFIVRIELHPSDKEQAYSAVHGAMEAAGFSRIYRDSEGVRHHLPASEYCLTEPSPVEAIRDRAAAAVGKVTTHFMLLVSETSRIAIAGLVPVVEKNLPPVKPIDVMAVKAA
jgi:hypothetical protein